MSIKRTYFNSYMIYPSHTFIYVTQCVMSLSLKCKAWNCWIDKKLGKMLQMNSIMEFFIEVLFHQNNKNTTITFCHMNSVIMCIYRHS